MSVARVHVLYISHRMVSPERKRMDREHMYRHTIISIIPSPQQPLLRRSKSRKNRIPNRKSGERVTRNRLAWEILGESDVGEVG